MKIESPLELEVLMYYHITDRPHPMISNKEHKKAIDKFISVGILEEKSTGFITANRDATNCYFDKIKEIELPTQIWK